MNKIRSMTVAAAALVVCLSAAREGNACSCVTLPNESDIRKALKTADAVFTAEAVASDSLGSTLKVEKVWKGAIGDRVMMQHATVTARGLIEQSSCDYTFTANQKYLVFAAAAPGGVMVAKECGATGPIDSAAKTMVILGPPLESPDDQKGPEVKSP